MHKVFKRISTIDWISISLVTMASIAWLQVSSFEPKAIDLLLYVATGLIAYLVFRFILHLMTLGVPVHIPSTDGNTQIDWLVGSFRDRARKIKIACRYILLTILISLVFGAWIFVYADIVARQSQAQITLEEMRFRFNELTSRITRSADPRASDEVMRQLGELTAQIAKQIERVDETNRARSTTEVIVSTLSTRIGSIFLLLFLVQILVSLYRYNMKLAAFYDGRADALLLLGTVQGLKFDQLIQLTLADSLDFGKTEKAPAEYALELAKKLLDKSDSKKSE